MARVIRVDALWLSVAPLDMWAGMDTLLAQVVQVFGEARPHHAYLFANRRGTRLKVLVHGRPGDLARLPAPPSGEISLDR